MPLGRVYEAAANRYAVRYQVEAALGGLRTVRGAPWGMERLPFHHMLPPWGAFPELDLELPEDQEQPPEGPPGALPRVPGATIPGATRAPARRTGAGDYEQRSYVLRMVRSAGDTQLHAASTPTIPTPCIIVGASIHHTIEAAANGSCWGVNITQSDVTGKFDDPIGSSVFESTRLFDPLAGDIAGWSPDTPIPYLMFATSNAQFAHTTALIGKLITDNNARLTYLSRWIGGAAQSSELVITVRTLDFDTGVVSRIQAAPRITAPRPPSAPTPRPPAVAPAPAITPRGAIFGFVPQTFVTGTPSQAVSLQNIWAGTAAVTAPAKPLFFVKSTGLEAVPFHR